MQIETFDKNVINKTIGQSNFCLLENHQNELFHFNETISTAGSGFKSVIALSSYYDNFRHLPRHFSDIITRTIISPPPTNLLPFPTPRNPDWK